MLQDFMLHLFLMALGFLFNCFRIFDGRFGRAVRSYEAEYAFRTPSSARTLLFSRGRIRTRKGVGPSPDYEIVILDPPGALKTLMKNPDDLLTLIVENKINQKGNLFFLYKLGYLVGLCNARLGGLTGWRGSARQKHPA